MDVLGLTLFRQLLLRVDGLDAHLPHQPSDTFLVHCDSLHEEHAPHCPDSGCGMFAVVLVHLVHDVYVALRLRFLSVVECASVCLRQLTEPVPAHAGRTFLLQLPYFFFRPALSQASAKKSTSTVSCPTFFRSLSRSLRNAFISLLSVSLYSKTMPDFSMNSFLHSVICLGAISYFLAKSLNVSLSFIASNTTLVLNVESYLLFLPISSIFLQR